MYFLLFAEQAAQSIVRTILAVAYLPYLAKYCFLLALSLGLWHPVYAQDSRGQSEHVTATLGCDVQQVQGGQSFWVGIQLKMQPDWHTYWKNAGDAGLPTKVQWSLPEGFRISELHWPVPTRFLSAGIVGYGYADQVILLAQVTPPAVLEQEAVTLRARVDWLECADICIPGKANLALTLPVTPGLPQPNAAWAEAFTKARQQWPQKLADDWAVQALRHGRDYILTLKRESADANPNVAPVYFFAADDAIALEAPQRWQEEGEGYQLQLTGSSLAGDEQTTLSGVLVTSTSWLKSASVPGLEVEVPLKQRAAPPLAVAQQEPLPPPTAADEHPLYLQLLFFAFIGGLILNLMPCVFPVLGIKVLGFVKQSNSDPRKIRQHGIIFTLGVLLSFWALSGLLLFLRAGGEQFGWGFQLQEPLFVAVLAALLFVLSLNFAGLFELGTRLMGVGSQLTSQEGYRGTFFSGVLAVVVATPCTAPFMGTAVGAALGQSAYHAMGIFTFLGLGMALPYLLFSYWPALLHKLPKPGPWMESFKQAMAFPLLATVIWLLWVFGQQTDIDRVTQLLFGLLLLGFAGWCYGRWQSATGKKTRIIAYTLALVAVAGGLYLGHRATAQHPAAALVWEPYSKKQIIALQAAGKTVYVDFTAAWCLTCQVNKRVVFSSDRVIEAFKKRGVVPMKADWTNNDPVITEALAEFGRSGVPLNVIYPAGAEAQPLVLPTVLTPDIVLAALRKIQSS